MTTRACATSAAGAWHLKVTGPARRANVGQVEEGGGVGQPKIRSIARCIAAVGSGRHPASAIVSDRRRNNCCICRCWRKIVVRSTKETAAIGEGGSITHGAGVRITRSLIRHGDAPAERIVTFLKGLDGPNWLCKKSD